MMGKQEIYEMTLQKMALDGSPEALLALDIASKVPTPRQVDVLEVSESLRTSIRYLGAALEANGSSWCSRTDREINNAISEITKAMQSLI